MENKPSKSELLRQQSQTQMLPIDMTNYLKKLRDTYKFYPKVVFDIGSNLLHWVNEARNIWTEAEFFLFDATDSLELPFPLIRTT